MKSGKFQEDGADYFIFEFMLKYILGLLPLSVFGQIFPADTVQPRTLIVDQDSLHFNIHFEPEQGLVIGDIDLYVAKLEKTDSIWLDAKPSVEIVDVPRFNSEEVSWKRFKNGVVLYPNTQWEKGRIQLEFSSRPFKGVYFNGWDDPSGEARKQIFTQGQGIDHRHWLPHVDAQNDKLKTSMSITFQNGFEVMGNGMLKEKKVDGDNTTWTYAMDHPHSSYLIAFVIGEYNEQVVGTEPLRAIYMYKDMMDEVPTTYYANEQVWNYLNERIGYPYVWSSYRQAPVANFPHGAMENTCMTIFSEQFIAGPMQFEDRNYTYVNAHELAHHWFGDLVTVPSSHDFWLHEGFATYYQMEAEREVFGVEHYLTEWLKAMKMVDKANEVDQYPLQHSKAGSSRFYQLGALTLRALEAYVGRETFDEAVSIYLERYAFGLVTTDSFKEVLEEVCDCRLNDFFISFVENPHAVTCTVDRYIDEETNELVYRVKQQNAFGRPLPIEHMEAYVWKSLGGEYVEEKIEVDFSYAEWEEVYRSADHSDFLEFDPNFQYPVHWNYEVPDSIVDLMVLVGTPYVQTILMPQFNVNSEAMQLYSELYMFTNLQISRDSILKKTAAEVPDQYFVRLEQQLQYDEDYQIFAENYPAEQLSSDRFDELLLGIQSGSDLSDNEAKSVAMMLIRANSGRIGEILNALDTRDGGIDKDIDLLCAFLVVRVKGTSHPDGIPRLMLYASAAYSNEIRLAAWQYLGILGYAEKDLRDIQYAALASRHRHIRNAAKAKATEYLKNMDAEVEIQNIKFALRNAHPDDIARVERILDIQLED